MTNFRNPTTVTLGLSGTFMGKRYRVAGRVVMGMEQDGQTYYWNEFNLVGDDGQPATLVYEVTDAGPQWRMFVLFEPQNPISAQEAAAKKVGDTVNLDGRDLRVTLVDESRVHYIEGQAPEGVELGDVACYFNAELPNRMVVVSWTGDEVECYHGVDLPRGTVATAFGLERETTGFVIGNSLRATPATPTVTPMVRKFVLLAFMILPVLMFWFIIRPMGCRNSPSIRPQLPAAPLTVGAEGNLQRTTWNIRGHAVTEIAQVGQIYDRHEYYLGDALGKKTLLVFGTKPGATDWMLFTPFQPDAALMPVQAAAKRLGDKLNLDGESFTITAIVRSTLRQTKGQNLPDLTDGMVLYGFTAQSAAGPVLARWNATNLVLYRGQTLSAKEVKQAFDSKPAR